MPTVFAQPTDPHASRHQAMIQSARSRVQSAGEKPTASQWIALGDAQLRGGKSREAVESFEKALALDPSATPHLWQYGIALYFVGRYEDGRSLFEQHRRVNPNDVENAAWHFVCAAKETDVDQARKIVLPAPRDPRPPMQAVLERLPGGEDAGIETAVKELKGSPQYDSAEFFGNLYLGLIADAEGDLDRAVARMKAAAATEMTHYMADVARVYADDLTSRNQGAKPER